MIIPLSLGAACLVAGIAGLVFQSLLHGGRRIIVYPLSFFLGVAGGMAFGTAFDVAAYYALSFGSGMAGRAALGGYWNCVAMEAGCLLGGLIVGVYLL
jgi:hypothetical protein